MSSRPPNFPRCRSCVPPIGRVTALIQTATLAASGSSNRRSDEQPFPEGVATQVLPSDAASPGNEHLRHLSGPHPARLAAVALARRSRNRSTPRPTNAWPTCSGHRRGRGRPHRGARAAWSPTCSAANRGSRGSRTTSSPRCRTNSRRRSRRFGLLVDTLLDADSSPDAPFGDHVRAREYLEMIAKENSRLSRLIDNFLTFSRMERGKHRFELRAGRRRDDRRAGGRRHGRSLRRRHEHSSPSASNARCRSKATSDALVTVVVNLLDNAWKYSTSRSTSPSPRGERATRSKSPSPTTASASRPWAARRVFDRFYQVDQHLSRSQERLRPGPEHRQIHRRSPRRRGRRRKPPRRGLDVHGLAAGRRRLRDASRDQNDETLRLPSPRRNSPQSASEDTESNAARDPALSTRHCGSLRSLRGELS